MARSRSIDPAWNFTATQLNAAVVGTYGAGYPGYYGGWANRSYVTGRPTLFPRYYAGNYGDCAYGGYPYGYYPGTPWGGPTLFPRYYGGGW